MHGACQRGPRSASSSRDILPAPSGCRRQSTPYSVHSGLLCCAYRWRGIGQSSRGDFSPAQRTSSARASAQSPGKSYRLADDFSRAVGWWGLGGMGSGIPLDRQQETCDGWSIRIVSGGRTPFVSTRTTATDPRSGLPVPPAATPKRLEEPTAMLHFSCDICGKDLTPKGQARYVVKMEAFAATDPAQLTDDDLDTDHVEEMAQTPERDRGRRGGRAGDCCRPARRCGSTCARCATASSSRIRSAAKPPPASTSARTESPARRPMNAAARLRPRSLAAFLHLPHLWGCVWWPTLSRSCQLSCICRRGRGNSPVRVLFNTA